MHKNPMWSWLMYDMKPEESFLLKDFKYKKQERFDPNLMFSMLLVRPYIKGKFPHSADLQGQANCFYFI